MPWLQFQIHLAKRRAKNNLLSLSTAVKNKSFEMSDSDLEDRADDGVIELSNGVWMRLCDALKEGRNEHSDIQRLRC